MLLTKEQQDNIVDVLIDYGLVDINAAKKVYAEVVKSGQPILAALKARGVATDDCFSMLQPLLLIPHMSTFVMCVLTRRIF